MIFVILAEATADSLARDIGQATAMVSGFGFAVWYAWYMTTNRIPAIEAVHREQLSASEQRHEAHISLLITNFRADLTEMWKVKREDDQRLATAIEKLAGSIEEQECRYNAARP